MVVCWSKLGQVGEYIGVYYHHLLRSRHPGAKEMGEIRDKWWCNTILYLNWQMPVLRLINSGVPWYTQDLFTKCVAYNWQQWII